MNRHALRRLAVMLAMTATASCTARPLRVGLAFDNEWQMGREALTLQEQARAKAVALQTLQDAFRGFDVTVREGRDADRLIVVDKGFVAGLRPVGQPAPVGETLPFAWVSRVHFDELCGSPHWSDTALTIMRRVLPAEAPAR